MHTIGTTPVDEIRDALAGEHYEMMLVGEDAKTVHRLVNVGIDSHLEACFMPDRGDAYELIADNTRLRCRISPDSMLVLLRRLHEDESESAWSLRSSILSTLDIEEV